MTDGPVGWGDECGQAATGLKDSLNLIIEGVTLGRSGMKSSDVDDLDDAALLMDLSTEKMNESRLLGDVFCSVD